MARRGFSTEKFEGFTVAVAGNTSTECNYWIPKLNVTLGNYHMTDSFYVVNLADTSILLGVQWLYLIEKYTTDYRAMEMEFQGSDGKQVVLRGMNTYPPKPVSSQRMEAVLRQGDIEYVVTFRKPPDNNTQRIFMHYCRNTRRYFGIFQQVDCQTGDLSISLSWRRGQRQSSPLLTGIPKYIRIRSRR